MMTIDESLTEELVRRILSITQPDRIILFGSAATGSMTKDSDIDLLVLGPPEINTMEERRNLDRALCGLKYGIDVFIMNTERFEETKNVIGGLAYPANKYGRVIYANA